MASVRQVDYILWAVGEARRLRMQAEADHTSRPQERQEPDRLVAAPHVLLSTPPPVS